MPESPAYRHSTEGRDDMPSHIKSSLLGVSVTLPVRAGRLVLGTWQGVYLVEHREGEHRRKAFVTLLGL